MPIKSWCCLYFSFSFIIPINSIFYPSQSYHFYFYSFFFFCVVYKEIDLLVVFSHSSLLTYTCQKILSFLCCQNFGIYRQTCLCTLKTYKGLTALSEMCLWILSSMLGLPSFRPTAVNLTVISCFKDASNLTLGSTQSVFKVILSWSSLPPGTKGETIFSFILPSQGQTFSLLNFLASNSSAFKNFFAGHPGKPIAPLHKPPRGKLVGGAGRASDCHFVIFLKIRFYFCYFEMASLCVALVDLELTI